jgi:hypothetical protein
VSTRRCPKCDAEVGAVAEACATCGLATAHFESFAAEQEETPPQLVELWDGCVADWDSEATHEKFLAAAAALDAFVHAGRLYRRAARERGSADPRVTAGLDRVRRMAEAAWLTRPAGQSSRADGSEKGGSYRTAALLLLSLLLVAGLGGITLYIVRTLRSGDRQEVEVRPPTTRQPPKAVGN